MRFKRFGKTYQLRLATGEDLEDILALDESLWAATSAPTAAFRCDPSFLKLVDSDGNGRIYTYELTDAVQWLLDRLADRSGVADGKDTVSLAAIQADTPEGEALLDSARSVLKSLQADDAEMISLEQVRGFIANFQEQPLNGDGVIGPEATDDPETADFIRDIIACTGGTTDVGGQQGINDQNLSDFMSAVNDYLEWKNKLDVPPDQESTPLMPLGRGTPQAADVYRAHAEKVNLFFESCEIARFEPRAAARFAIQDSSLLEMDTSDAGSLRACLEQAPLAEPNSEGRLPLAEESVNPFYREWISALKEQVLQPILGAVPEHLSQADWVKVNSALAPYEAYLKEKKGASVEGLPIDKLQQYRDGPHEQRLRDLIASDSALTETLKAAQELEKLLLYQQNIMRLANNFVSFPELYATDQRALFEVGSVVIDGRWFDFALKVDNAAAHSAVAEMSNIFVVYLEITDAEDEKFTVAMPATSGTKGNLSVGKRGIFFDIDGKEYDAQVIRIIPNPISLREALAAPFVRLWGFAAGKIEALSGTGEKKLQAELTQTVTDAQKPAAASGGVPGGSTGMILGLSVAGAAVGSALAFIMKTLAGLEFYQIALGIGGAVLVVGLPITFMAISKLRRQDLSALLEGCGWAVNARMRLTRSQRKYLTRHVPYPRDAWGTPRRRWVRRISILVIIMALAVGGYYGAKALLRPRPEPEKPAEPQPTTGDKADAPKDKDKDAPAPKSPPTDPQKKNLPPDR